MDDDIAMRRIIVTTFEYLCIAIVVVLAGAAVIASLVGPVDREFGLVVAVGISVFTCFLAGGAVTLGVLWLTLYGETLFPTFLASLSRRTRSTLTYYLENRLRVPVSPPVPSGS